MLGRNDNGAYVGRPWARLGDPAAEDGSCCATCRTEGCMLGGSSRRIAHHGFGKAFQISAGYLGSRGDVADRSLGNV